MAVVDIFSKRKARLEGAGKADVYQYDLLPQPFRVQVVHIWRDAMGPYVVDSFNLSPFPIRRSASNGLWEFIQQTVCREKGLFCLADGAGTPNEQCVSYLMGADTDGAIDIIEVSFRLIDRSVRQLGPGNLEDAKIRVEPDAAIEELNQRFREHGIGYQYAAGIIVRIDSQLIHAEAVKPALSLLGGPGFEGPSDEFIRAFDHYRHGRHKEAVAEALKALESTMKAICQARKWSHPPNATAKPLMDLLFGKNLIPAELESHFAGLRSAMESGLPTLSNRTSRHGQGPELKPIPPHFAAYALHLAAANIVFLVEAHNAAG